MSKSNTTRTYEAKDRTQRQQGQVLSLGPQHTMAQFEICVAGWEACSFFAKARSVVEAVASLHHGVAVDVTALADRAAYKAYLPTSPAAGTGHTSSPACWVKEGGAVEFVGGVDDLFAMIRDRFPPSGGGGGSSSSGGSGVGSKRKLGGAEESSGNGGSGGSDPILLFISGDRSQVGKSSVCLGLLGALLEKGYAPGELAYIKPATQCESPQLVTKFCDAKGIAQQGVGPVVFYSGFTREYLKVHNVVKSTHSGVCGKVLVHTQ